MIHLRKLLLISGQKRFCSQAVKHKIHESIRSVDPYSNVRINCSLNATIRPIDLFNYPDSNQLRILAFSDINDSKVEIQVKGDEKNIEINENSSQNGGMGCIFEVPVKCNLKVRSKRDVSISELYSDCIDVEARSNILTKNLRSVSISLNSKGGNITCDGLTLAQQIDIKAGGSGDVHLEKIQGDLLECISSEGRISTNSCYAESSKFVTESGTMNLKNVHKKSSVYVLKEGDVNMTGIHGNLLVKMNGGNLNLQFSEIIDDSVILSNDSKKVLINISDLIEETCLVDLQSDEIVLNESASHLLHYLKENRFRLGNDNCKNKLVACTSGKLTLGKSSWAESLKTAMGYKE